MNHYSLRPATTDDLHQIFLIERESNVQPWSEDILRSTLAVESTYFWVLTDDEDDDLIIGFIVFRYINPQAHIQEFAVRSNLRKRGFGSFIIRKVISFILKLDGESLYLEVRRKNETAIKFYQKLGFVIIHTKNNFYSNGDDAYSMIFKLKNMEENEK